MIDKKKHWLKAWARLIGVFVLGLEQRRLHFGFSRIKKFVVAKEVMLTKIFTKISSQNLADLKKKSAFDKLRQLNLRENYVQRKFELHNLLQEVDQENSKIDSIKQQL